MVKLDSWIFTQPPLSLSLLASPLLVSPLDLLGRHGHRAGGRHGHRGGGLPLVHGDRGASHQAAGGHTHLREYKILKMARKILTAAFVANMRKTSKCC